MKKKAFLLALEEVLDDLEFEGKEIKRIVNDYQNLIEEAVQAGKDEAEFIDQLGSVRDLARSLKTSLPKTKRPENLLVALSPFIAVITFFLLGFLLNAWHPGWLVFLFIPIIAILTESRSRQRFVGLFPIVYTIFFILIGTYSGTPFLSQIFSTPGFGIGLLWHPFWAGYIYTAVIAYLLDVKITRKIIGLVSFLLVSTYIYLELFLGFAWWHFGLLLLVALLAIIDGGLKIVFDLRFKSNNERINTIITLGVSLLATVVYVILGISYELWGVMWVVFLVIPMVAIYLAQRSGQEKFKLVAYTPFIAVSLFFLVGYFFGLFNLSWLFFLIIPMTAIIEERLNP